MPFTRVRISIIPSPIWSLLILLLLAQPALAHKVFLFAWVEGDTVHCDAYFSKSRKVQGGTITVKDGNGKVLAQGETDSQGAWTFPVPGRMDLFLEVEAGTGHKGEFMIAADELPGAESESLPLAKAEDSPPAAGEKVAVRSPEQLPAGTDMEAIRAVVAAELDRRLQPLARSIAMLREDQGPSLTEIIGGIGYIFGIMGLVMYFRSKKQ